jgi:Ca2+:H+ antiporter
MKLIEVLLKTVDDVIAGANIDERYLGLTLFALAPNFTEFLNAIAFAMYGNIELSLEIGSAYTLQVALLQIPSLIAFSAFYNWNGVKDPKRAFE